ncbi:TPA: DNA-binding protein [bacterium]|nr:DNA-binding protein [bacterium]
MLKKLIVDTNIVFSALLGKSRKIREILFSSEDIKPYSCKYSIVELFKHKDKLISNSALDEEEILNIFYYLLKRIEFYNEDFISDNSLKKAYELCNDIDEKDLLFVALTIELDGLLWTGDKELLRGLIRKGFEQIFILK